jgi:hypothetical protein
MSSLPAGLPSLRNVEKALKLDVLLAPAATPVESPEKRAARDAARLRDLHGNLRQSAEAAVLGAYQPVERALIVQDAALERVVLRHVCEAGGSLRRGNVELGRIADCLSAGSLLGECWPAAPAPSAVAVDSP